jgi:hypothetical protein
MDNLSITETNVNKRELYIVVLKTLFYKRNLKFETPINLPGLPI